MRLRLTAISSGQLNVSGTVTAGLLEPAPSIQLALNGTLGSNPCLNPHASLQSLSVTTSGTAAVQIVGLVAGQKVYFCSLSVVGQSGTTPTFSIVTGTGANCAAGQAVLIPAFTTPANTMIPFANPVAVVGSGLAACYLQTGTTPVTLVAFSFVQQ